MALRQPRCAAHLRDLAAVVVDLGRDKQALQHGRRRRRLEGRQLLLCDGLLRQPESLPLQLLQLLQ